MDHITAPQGHATVANYHSVDQHGQPFYKAMDITQWRQYNIIPVNKNGGAKIYDTQDIGTHTQVHIFCPVQPWNWGLGNASTETPLGTGKTDWPGNVHPPTYKNAYRWGVILYQTGDEPHFLYTQILATLLVNPQVIKLEPNCTGIYVAVNDGQGDYHTDNSGEFSIYVKLS